MSDRLQSATKAYRKAMEFGRKKDESAADLKRLTEAFYAAHGEAVRGRLPEGVEVDAQGNVRVAGLDSWANGSLQLMSLAEFVVQERWAVVDLANFLRLVREEAGHEPAHAVQEIVRTLATEGELTHDEISHRLREEAARIERESFEGQ